jgi:hypothetical protein
MRGATTAAIGALLAALPAAAPAQIGTGTPTGAGLGTMTVVPPGPSGGSNGSAMGSTRPYYHDYAYRERVCWHERGYRHCRWC